MNAFYDVMEKYLKEAELDEDVPRFLEESSSNDELCDKVTEAYRNAKQRNGSDIHHLFFAYMQYLADTYHLSPADLEMGSYTYLMDVIASAGSLTQEVMKRAIQDVLARNKEE